MKIKDREKKTEIEKDRNRKAETERQGKIKI